MKIVIIGGTGLVGRAAARRLLDSGWRVDVIGRSASHIPPEIADARFIAADRNVRYEAVIGVIDLIKQVGIASFALNIERSDPR